MSNYNRAMSEFPDYVDYLVFLSDLKASQKEDLDEFVSLCMSGDYDAANFMFKTSNLDGINADLINAIKSRIQTLQTYLKTIIKDEVIITQDTEPTTSIIGISWVSSE